MKNFMYYIALFAVIGALIFAYFSFQSELQRKKLPEMGQIKHFDLIDSDNKPFTYNDVKGRVWVASFFFTTCSDICPTISKNMASLHQSFKLVNGIELVSFSVNPENDNPEVLRVYADKYGADTAKWHFVTGKRENLRKLIVEDFKLGSIEEPIFHSAYFALVDRSGYIRGYYDGLEKKKVNELFRDAALLVKERF